MDHPPSVSFFFASSSSLPGSAQSVKSYASEGFGKTKCTSIEQRDFACVGLIEYQMRKKYLSVFFLDCQLPSRSFLADTMHL